MKISYTKSDHNAFTIIIVYICSYDKAKQRGSFNFQGWTQEEEVPRISKTSIFTAHHQCLDKNQTNINI